MGRTIEDLILLDSILRNSGYNSTTNGALDTPVSCAVSVNPQFSLQGVRIGLPSNFGWVNNPYAPAMQGEVRITDFAHMQSCCTGTCQSLPSIALRCSVRALP